ncbi:DUF3301 domain-containing protein [Idiomarina seosinensis]|uniref:DUF3301 domain-containing protein n=1 Tax=Idiomarina seosinensis TaxID=281739 RepID=A0A432ZHF2_9GAMM|nr:DUF3301 domain-containing protein [Idiomarina seosinensis]RUO77314.1 DUF3301 domain-containing protein [Idiomarina seosinensis]
MNLVDVLVLLAIVLVGWVFWQHRQQSESADRHARYYCKQQQLQFLDVRRDKTRWSFKGRQPGWRATFKMGFSSDGETRYEGNLELHNQQLIGVDLPAFREPTVH